MEVIRIGRVVRAIRRRRGWRQIDLAARIGVSQSLIARVERGGAGRVRLDTLDRIAAALDARLVVRIDWLGEAADRLLDADHADVVERLVTFLRAAGWEVVPEATFNVAGERGSIDILGWHAPTATLLVVEVQTVVPDVQGMLSTFDRKVRHADGIRACSRLASQPDLVATRDLGHTDVPAPSGASHRDLCIAISASLSSGAAASDGPELGTAGVAAASSRLVPATENRSD